MDTLDDAAAAALYRLAHEPREHMGALYAAGDGYARTPTVTSYGKGKVKGSLAVPTGTLRALFHNHPAFGARDTERAKFSADDKAQARQLRVPSYIDAGGRVMRFNPKGNTTEEVLAQFPIDEWRAQIMQIILGRSPDDPRGAYR